MQKAQALISAGRPRDALPALQAAVRAAPADVKRRIFLFQLLCVLGDWDSAATQLELCGQLDAGALMMVNTYREALSCELVRESVFAGATTPIVLGQPEEWLACLLEALRVQSTGDAQGAARLRAMAVETASPTAGRLNGEPFDWVIDADSRLGPVLEAIINGRYCWVPFSALRRVTMEAPQDLRDLIWAPVELELASGGTSVALVPARYCGLGDTTDEAMLMARSSGWEPLFADQFAGQGQRVIATSADEVGLLQVRELILEPASA